jgi:ABC-type antimicrobial peptide transport system permease subunit
MASDLFLYVPIAQDYLPQVSVAVRTEGAPEAVVEPLRRAIRSVDPELAVSGQTVADAIGFLLAPIRAAAWILGGLGSLGLGIALLGVYGMVAYSSSQRMREFGIRKALGATTAGIYIVVLRSSLRMLIVGTVPGMVVAFVAAGFLRNLVYGIDSRDPLTFIAVPAVLILAGVGAAALAARRAARVDPRDALRSL